MYNSVAAWGRVPGGRGPRDTTAWVNASAEVPLNPVEGFLGGVAAVARRVARRIRRSFLEWVAWALAGAVAIVDLCLRTSYRLKPVLPIAAFERCIHILV